MAPRALVSSPLGRGSVAIGLSLLTLAGSLTTALPALAQEANEEPAATAEANDTPSAEESTAPAESEKAAPTEPNGDTSGESAEKTDDDFGHIGQFGLRAGLVAGYRMIFRYSDSPFCTKPEEGKPAKDQQVFCGHGAPLAMDVALSFALLDSLELFGFGRFGLTAEEQTDTEAVRAFGVGARLYTMSAAKMKIFVQPAAGMSFEGAGDNPDWQSYQDFKPSYKSDLLFQLSVGPQYDFNRYFGLYASGGVTVGVLRAMSANLEGTIGLQGRAP